MIRVGVITDAHANLPAINAALTALESAGCDQIVHTGDAIGIGPHPREVLELLLNRSSCTLLSGNHDEWFAFDQLQHRPPWMSPGELQHHRWTHEQLRDEWRNVMQQWPRVHDLTIGSTTIRFQHYAINDGDFGPISQAHRPDELDAAFRPTTDIVFFGHHHPRADVRGRARYINPGALGTNPSQGARYAIIEEQSDGTVEISLHAVPYNADVVRNALRERRVPEADFILGSFLRP